MSRVTVSLRARLLWSLSFAGLAGLGACTAVSGCSKRDAAGPSDDPAGGQSGEADEGDDAEPAVGGRGGAAGGGGSAAGGSGAEGPAPGPSNSGTSAKSHYFPPGAPWNQDVSKAPKDPESEAIISWLDGQGFGLGRMQIDFSLEILRADDKSVMRTFEPTDDFFEPDCDEVPLPLPSEGSLEGESGYACEGDGDCHLIVVDEANKALYEMWRADVRGNTFVGGCLARWELNRVYPPEGRGDQCSSADAAGFPIAPLLFTADEVAAGEIPHALRFILPNARIRKGEYVRPATHGTRATTGPKTAPPYGVRLRLRADYPLDTLPNEGARVVARALQKYGMLLADGGNITLTARSDRRTKAKWADHLAPRDLQALKPRDFEVVKMGDPIPLTLQCQRSK